MDITKILSNAADTDMRKARKPGGLLITGTKRGLLDLTYKDGIYTLETQMTAYSYMAGERSEVLACGPAKVVKSVLMQMYVVNFIS